MDTLNEANVPKECSEKVVVFFQIQTSEVLACSYNLFGIHHRLFNLPNKVRNQHSNYFSLQSQLLNLSESLVLTPC